MIGRFMTVKGVIPSARGSYLVQVQTGLLIKVLLVIAGSNLIQMVKAMVKIIGLDHQSRLGYWIQMPSGGEGQRFESSHPDCLIIRRH